MFTSPFPAQVVWSVVNLRKAARARSAGALRKEERRLVDQATESALSQLGFVPAPTVGRGAHREPLWPPGICGSITHSGEWLVLAVSRDGLIRSLGLDLEQTERSLRPGFTERIAQPVEQDWIRSEPEQTTKRSIILFSAKEAVYKAWFPVIRRFLNFSDVVLSARADGGFTGKLLVPLDPGLNISADFTVRCVCQNGYVLSSVQLT